MEHTNNTNCCTPSSESTNTTDCCSPNNEVSKNSNGMKKKFGLGILGLALILALTTAFKGSNDTAVVSCITENSGTPSKADFEWIKTDKNVAYVLLKGEDATQNEKLTSKIEGIVSELNETDGSAYFIALEAKNPNHQDAVSKLNVTTIPAVAVLGKSAKIIDGANINSTKLIRAYDIALTSKASCSPTEKASCAGKSKASCNPKAAKTSCTPQQKATCAGSKKAN